MDNTWRGNSYVGGMYYDSNNPTLTRNQQYGAPSFMDVANSHPVQTSTYFPPPYTQYGLQYGAGPIEASSTDWERSASFRTDNSSLLSGGSESSNSAHFLGQGIDTYPTTANFDPAPPPYQFFDNNMGQNYYYETEAAVQVHRPMHVPNDVNVANHQFSVNHRNELAMGNEANVQIHRPMNVLNDPNVVNHQFDTNHRNELVMRNGRNLPDNRAKPYGRNRKPRGSPKQSGSSSDDSTTQRHIANGRERSRTRKTNIAFSVLRQIIPSLPSDKLSKIQTLRLATQYILFLTQRLHDGHCVQPEPDYRDFTMSVTREKLSRDFSFWRLKEKWPQER